MKNARFVNVTRRLSSMVQMQGARQVNAEACREVRRRRTRGAQRRRWAVIGDRDRRC